MGTLRSVGCGVAFCVMLAAPAAAQTTGWIAGRVVDTAGTPVNGIRVYAQGGEIPFRNSITDVDGNFTISDLAPGTYFLTAFDSLDRFTPTIYGTRCPSYRCAPQSGTPILVTAGALVNGIIIPITLGGTIEARLLDAVTMSLIGQGGVDLYDEEGYHVFVPESFPGGTYRLQPVPPGRYYLLAWMRDYEDYVSELSDGRHCSPPCSITGGIPFEVRSGETVTRDLLLDRGGQITGRVLDAVTGEPIYGASYIAESLDGLVVRGGSHITGAGESTITDLPPGRYIVRAVASPHLTPGYIPESYGGVHIPCSDDSPACLARYRTGTPVEVTAGATTAGIDILLDRGGAIAGGLTIAGPVSPSVTIEALTPTGVVAARAFVSAPGAYRLDGLPAGSYYVCASGTAVATQAFGGSQFAGSACPPAAGTPVAVTGTAVTAGIDLTLTPLRGEASATLSGTIRSSGVPVQSVWVRLYRNGEEAGLSSSDSQGKYEFRFVPAGTYHLRTESVFSNYVDEWHGGACVACGDGIGSAVNVQSGAVLTGIDFDLSVGGLISGSVNAGAVLSVYDANGRLVQRKSTPAAGAFLIHGLPSGTYYVMADNGSTTSDFLPVIYPGVDCTHAQCAPQDGTAVTVTQGGSVTGGINLVMRHGGTIRGRAVTATAELLDQFGEYRRFQVQAYDAAGRPVGRFVSYRDGFYEIRGLLSGNYYVRTTDGHLSGFADQVYRGRLCAGCSVTSGSPVPVIEGRVTDLIDFALQRAGSISGTLRDAATSAPIENVTVQALSRNGSVVGTAVSTMDGSYVIRGLPPASYYVAVPPGSLYLPRRYTSPTCVYCDPAVGDRVAVSATTNATGVDIPLQRGARITGRASRADGAPLTDIAVSIVNASGTSAAQVVTDADGAYIATVPAGTYFARAQGSGGFRTQMFNGVTCPRGICNTGTATALSVTTGAIRAGVDFPLQQCAPPVIGPSALPSAMVGSNYSSTIQASHGVAPYGFVLASGALPPGLSLDASTGVLRGVVAIAGDYQFTVGVTDNAGCGAMRQYTVSIGECRVTPSTTSVAFTAQGGSADVAIESTCEWPVGVVGSWISVTNIVRGAGGNVRISAPFNSGAARDGFVAVGSTRIAVRQAALTSTAPFGQFDLPRDGVQVSGSIALGGWALDDVHVARITIYRDSVAPEPPGHLVFIGNGVSVRGARPDVEAAYPTMPGRERAGWGYLLLTNMLPNGGNGTFRLHAFAVDVEGNQVLLGSRTIVASNVAATAPFGAIDTPAQGGTISGTNYVNFGWALTPMPKSIPEDGSTITVYIDGAPIGNVNYGHFRGDIATLFPNLANSNGAVGFRIIDTTQLADGVHTIAWVVIDSAGAAKGIGSRFFTVANEGISAVNAASKIVADAAQRASTPEAASPQPAARSLAIAEMGHVAIDLAREFADAAACAGSYDGYEDVGAERRPLPVGSSLDAVTGQFAWHPGPGFIGSYRLVFERRDCLGNVTVMPVAITIAPKH